MEKRQIRRTVYSDLIELGMEPRIRSNAMENWKGYKRKPNGCRSRTIYERFSLEEILAIAKKLFRQRVKRLHPDIIEGRVEEFIRVVESYKHLRHVLALKESSL